MMIDNHILLLTPGFPKDENDFLCTPPVQDFLIKYKSEFPNTKFSVIAFQYPYKKINYVWNDIDVYALGGKNMQTKKFLIWNEAIKTVKAINKNSPIDVIHSLWFGECALVGNYLAKKINCNHICTLMGQDVKPSNYYLKFLNKKRVKVVSLSENLSKQYYQIAKRKIDFEIFWGIDNQIFNTENTRKIELLAVGSLIPIKNYKLFIKVIAQAVNIFPNLVSKLVGDGPELSVLKIMAAQYGIEKNIEFMGILSRKKIFTLMQQSKIFVHPSKFEGSGFVFAEALVNGMNIISFNVGYAKPSDKWFVAKDENDFVLLANQLLQNNLNYNPVNIFPISETVNRYKQLYNVGF